jgi:hypothetical protein
MQLYNDLMLKFERPNWSNNPELGLIDTILERNPRLINTFSWDAYHEGKEDFKKSVEAYRKIHGHYPELVQVDAIYPTRENREWAKDEKETAYQKRKRKKELAERNHIEGKIGQGKNGYEMNLVRTRLKQTGESWSACIVFVMNLVKMEADLKRKKRNSFWLYIKLLLDSWKQPHFTYVNYVKA